MSGLTKTHKRSDYEIYIHTEEILSLQKPPETRSHPDELLFQVIHQAAELWFKVLENESERSAVYFEEDNAHEAGLLLLRCEKIFALLCSQLTILETMPPQCYHAIRMGLGRGSGQDSPGFNNILEKTPIRLWDAFSQMLDRNNLSLLELHKNHLKYPALFQGLQGMIGFDEGFQSFRYHHFSLVRRVIGIEVKSLKGIPAQLLSKGTKAPLFPPLWEVVNKLTREWRPEY